VASRSKTVAVTVVFWEELLQDVMLFVLDAFEQSFVGVLCKLGRSRVTAAIQAKPNTSTDECFNALFIGCGGEPPPGWRSIEQLGQDYCSVLLRCSARLLCWLAEIIVCFGLRVVVVVHVAGSSDNGGVSRAVCFQRLGD